MHARIHGSSRRGFTLIEVLIAMIAASILLLAMGTVLFMIFRGFNESRDFANATNRVDLIRQLSFDARTGRTVTYPTTWDINGTPLTSRGDYATGGNEGDRVQFVSLRYDAGTGVTTPFMITWQSRRPTGSPVGTPYNVERWIQQTDALNVPIGAATLSFDQNKITSFEVIRTTVRTFSVNLQTTEGAETASVQLVVTCRNVVN